MELNAQIYALKQRGQLDTNDISDGYHTFGELYAHRIALFRALCEMLIGNFTPNGELRPTWKSKTHSDGSVMDGWFIAGIGDKPGTQITYHIPMSEWDTWPAEEIEVAPEFDGHTSADVLKRLKEL